MSCLVIGQHFLLLVEGSIGKAVHDFWIGSRSRDFSICELVNKVVLTCPCDAHYSYHTEPLFGRLYQRHDYQK